MFIVSPNTQKELSAAAKAITQNDSHLMDDLKFKASPSGVAGGPNATVLSFFSQMLPKWSGIETKDIAVKDVLIEFNRHNEGMYRRTCVIPFMHPFVAAGAVEVLGSDVLRIHVDRAARFIEK